MFGNPNININYFFGQFLNLVWHYFGMLPFHTLYYCLAQEGEGGDRFTIWVGDFDHSFNPLDGDFHEF